MKFHATGNAPEKARADCLLIAVYGAAKQLLGTAANINKASKNQLLKTLKNSDMNGTRGQILPIIGLPGVKARRVLCVDFGNNTSLKKTAFREVLSQVANYLSRSNARSVICTLTEVQVTGADEAWKIQQICRIFSDSLYIYDYTKSEKPPRPLLSDLYFPSHSKLETVELNHHLSYAQALNHAIDFAKTLENLPGNICTPTFMADSAKRLVSENKNLKVDILEASDMKKLGMGAMLSVSQGTKQPPKLIVMHYHGGHKKMKPIVLVGKGITFDTGGVSIKPREGMDEQKFDMTGAATVLACALATATLNLPINLIVVAACAENFISQEATKPGDVVTSMSGQTIEILNTDAEGRLVLCDALTYCERFQPAVVIDVATLTGSVILALGNKASGLFTEDLALRDELIASGDASFDRVWPMPIWEDYHESLVSNFADVPNIGDRNAGCIIAACFLSRFTKKYRWAHIDCAGVASNGGKAKGATGRPIPLLMQFLLIQSNKLAT